MGPAAGGPWIYASVPDSESRAATVGAVLAGRLSAHKILRSLLSTPDGRDARDVSASGRVR